MKEKIIKNYTLKLYYKYRICKLKMAIDDVRSLYAQRSSKSQRNFDFEEYLTQDDTIINYNKRIYKLKRRICQLQ